MPSSDHHRLRHAVVLWMVIALLGCEVGEALKVPFRVNDVLPVLPRQISWPVLNNLHSAVDLLPYFVGSLTPSNASIKWKGACFYDNTAKIELSPASQGAVLFVKVIIYPNFQSLSAFCFYLSFWIIFFCNFFFYFIANSAKYFSFSLFRIVSICLCICHFW